MAMDELDVVLLTVSGEPAWQPLVSDAGFPSAGGARLGVVEDVWAEVVRELERDLVWAEVVALFAGSRG